MGWRQLMISSSEIDRCKIPSRPPVSSLWSTICAESSNLNTYTYYIPITIYLYSLCPSIDKYKYQPFLYKWQPATHLFTISVYVSTRTYSMDIALKRQFQNLMHSFYFLLIFMMPFFGKK
jgi:hypothetical protein